MDKNVKKLKVVFVGITDYNDKKVALVFIAYKLGREKHTYDTMFMCSNLPAKDYVEYNEIPLNDLEVKCQSNGHIAEISFKGVTNE